MMGLQDAIADSIQDQRRPQQIPTAHMHRSTVPQQIRHCPLQVAQPPQPFMIVRDHIVPSLQHQVRDGAPFFP